MRITRSQALKGRVSANLPACAVNRRIRIRDQGRNGERLRLRTNADGAFKTASGVDAGRYRARLRKRLVGSDWQCTADRSKPVRVK